MMGGMDKPPIDVMLCTRCGGFDDTDSGFCRGCWNQDFPPEEDHFSLDDPPFDSPEIGS